MSLKSLHVKIFLHSFIDESLKNPLSHSAPFSFARQKQTNNLKIFILDFLVVEKFWTISSVQELQTVKGPFLYFFQLFFGF